MCAPTKYDYQRATHKMMMEGKEEDERRKKGKKQQSNEIPAHLGASFIGDYAMTQNLAQRLQFTRRYLLLLLFACTRVV